MGAIPISEMTELAILHLKHGSFSWRCPFCDHNATVREDDYSFQEHLIIKEHIEKKEEKQRVVRTRLQTILITCPNLECNRYTLKAILCRDELMVAGKWKVEKVLQEWSLIPPSEAKPFPDYVPKAILDDYKEACLIKDLSPKASATLSRRCLQGMIRDFWEIKKDRLKGEIDALEGKVEPQIWKAIESVRTVGNIGAHMGKDINLIVDIEPNEAGLLIKLIEILLNDWYIARHERETDLKAVVELAKSKELEQKDEKVEKEGQRPAK